MHTYLYLPRRIGWSSGAVSSAAETSTCTAGRQSALLFLGKALIPAGGMYTRYTVVGWNVTGARGCQRVRTDVSEGLSAGLPTIFRPAISHHRAFPQLLSPPLQLSTLNTPVPASPSKCGDTIHEHMSNSFDSFIDLDALDLNDLAFWERVAQHFRARLGGGGRPQRNHTIGVRPTDICSVLVLVPSCSLHSSPLLTEISSRHLPNPQPLR